MAVDEMEDPFVILVVNEKDEGKITVVGDFQEKAHCQEWADSDGSRILTEGINKAVAYRVMPPYFSEVILTGSPIGGFRPAEDVSGRFRGGTGVASPEGETADAVPTVVVTRIPVTDKQVTGPGVVTVPIGIFASNLDARKWVNQIDAASPEVGLGQAVLYRPVLTPDQFLGQVDTFVREGQVA